MKNVTLSLPEGILRKARIRAARDGTSVNEVIRKHLEQYASEQDRLDKAIDRIMELSEQYGKGRRLKKWTRDELYDRKSSRGG
jgi:plasmid stability protein